MPLPAFDFTDPSAGQQWKAAHDIGSVRLTREGMLLQVTGADPYLIGLPRDYPPGTNLWLRLRLKAEQGGSGQIFYSRDGFTERNSARFNVRPNEWDDVRVALPALGPGFKLRLDPPGVGGQVLLASMRFEPRVQLPTPVWPPWENPPQHSRKRVDSGGLEIYSADSSPGFEARVNGMSMAVEHPRPLIGYLKEGQVRWLDLTRSPASQSIARRGTGKFTQTLQASDPDGGTWTFERGMVPGRDAGTIDVETRVTVSADRQVVYLPMLILVAGEKSFGTNKTQGLFAGLEYLDNEPSSSEADIVGPASKRQVPATRKITFPLMAIQAQHRYLGLIWEIGPRFSALFDSPDRLFSSNGHIMGVLFPGSDGANREEGSLLPYYGEELTGGKPLTLRTTIIGGIGENVVEAIQHYVKLKGLPSLPATARQPEYYFPLATSGWLDSKIREGSLYRHAVWPGFGPQPAADAAVFMDWLASQSHDAGLSTRLHQTARDTITHIPPENFNSAAVGHVRYPLPSLVYGEVSKNAERAKAVAESLLSRFASDGSVRYQTSANRPDYSRTHFASHANGLTAQVVEQLVENAIFCGDRAVIEKALTHLRGLDQYRNTVPRGAQTWEVPLHTPDILASAHLVRAYTLGYELTGEKDFLEQAVYWAWTGVPFVYLINPTGGPVGPYSTIAVYGATNWKEPVWFGRPVQWCGMVYADTLYRLARHDPGGRWRQLADGITAAGIQHTWPVTDADRKGLLPDFFELPTQTRAGPAINPGTVMVSAVRLYEKPLLCDFHSFRNSGLLVHAPGEIVPIKDQRDAVRFRVLGWPEQPYFVLVNGLSAAPRVRIDGKEVTLAAPHEFQTSAGRLILRVEGKPAVEVLK